MKNQEFDPHLQENEPDMRWFQIAEILHQNGLEGAAVNNCFADGEQCKMIAGKTKFDIWETPGSCVLDMDQKDDHVIEVFIKIYGQPAEAGVNEETGRYVVIWKNKKPKQLLAA